MKRQTFMLVCMMLLCASAVMAQVQHPKVHHHSTYDHSGTIVSDQNITTIYSHATPTITCQIDNLTGSVTCGAASFSSVLGATGTYTNLFATDVFVLGTTETDDAIIGDGYGSTGCTFSNAGVIQCDGDITGAIFHGDGSLLTGITSATSTLQEIIDTGNTATRTDDNVIELTATSTYDAIQIQDATGATTGDGIQITRSVGTGDALNIRQTGATTSGYGIYMESSVNSNTTGYYPFRLIAANSPGLVVETTSNNFDTLQISNAGSNGLISGVSYYDQPAELIQLSNKNSSVAGCDPSCSTFIVKYNGNILTGNNTDNDHTSVLYASTTVSTGGFRLRNTNADANGASLIFDRAPHDYGVAGGDVIGKVYFNAYDAATTTATLNTYGTISTNVLDLGTGAESGQMVFSIADGGTVDGVLTIQGGATDTVMFNYAPQISTDIATGTVTCESTTRGMIVYDQGATDDSLSICMLVSSSYTWVQIKP